jgi:hypothetical protein
VIGGTARHRVAAALEDARRRIALEAEPQSAKLR